MKSISPKKSPGTDKPTAVDLFAGCGGLTLGVKQAGFRVLAAVEIDPAAVATYKANHPEVTVFDRDIRKIRAKRLMTAAGLARGRLDLLAGCPPCQGFSTLRTRNGAKQNRDRKNGLVREMLRFTRALLPRVVMMENVPGLEGRQVFREFRAALSALGYSVVHKVLDAADFGVPQRRRRLILVASRGVNIDLPAVNPTRRTVRDAISGLARAGLSGDRLHDMPERRSRKVTTLIRKIPKDGGGRDSLPRRAQLKCHRKNDGFHDIYGRMAWDRVAPTITSGCFNPSKGRFLHPQENRAITLREAALLQSFPADYGFVVSAGKERIAGLIGNALPPEFIRQHAAAIKNSIRSGAASHRAGGLSR